MPRRLTRRSGSRRPGAAMPRSLRRRIGRGVRRRWSSRWRRRRGRWRAFTLAAPRRRSPPCTPMVMRPFPTPIPTPLWGAVIWVLRLTRSACRRFSCLGVRRVIGCRGACHQRHRIRHRITAISLSLALPGTTLPPTSFRRHRHRRHRCRRHRCRRLPPSCLHRPARRPRRRSRPRALPPCRRSFMRRKRLPAGHALRPLRYALVVEESRRLRQPLRQPPPTGPTGPTRWHRAVCQWRTAWEEPRLPTRLPTPRLLRSVLRILLRRRRGEARGSPCPAAGMTAGTTAGTSSGIWILSRRTVVWPPGYRRPPHRLRHLKRHQCMPPCLPSGCSST